MRRLKEPPQRRKPVHTQSQVQPDKIELQKARARLAQATEQVRKGRRNYAVGMGLAAGLDGIIGAPVVAAGYAQSVAGQIRAARAQKKARAAEMAILKRRLAGDFETPDQKIARRLAGKPRVKK